MQTWAAITLIYFRTSSWNKLTPVTPIEYKETKKADAIFVRLGDRCGGPMLCLYSDGRPKYEISGLPEKNINLFFKLLNLFLQQPIGSYYGPWTMLGCISQPHYPQLKSPFKIHWCNNTTNLKWHATLWIRYTFHIPFTIKNNISKKCRSLGFT